MNSKTPFAFLACCWRSCYDIADLKTKFANIDESWKLQRFLVELRKAKNKETSTKQIWQNIIKRKNQFSAKNLVWETNCIQFCWLNFTFKVICHYLFNHKIQWIKYMDTNRKTKGFLSNCVQPCKGKRRKSRISFI